MIEDKLTKEERLRLECLNQAVQRNVMKPASNDEILETAKEFEKYIRGPAFTTENH
jgi:hypothetical protein